VPRQFSLKYVSIPAKKRLVQRENSSLPVTFSVFRYTLSKKKGRTRRWLPRRRYREERENGMASAVPFPYFFVMGGRFVLDLG